MRDDTLKHPDVRRGRLGRRLDRASRVDDHADRRRHLGARCCAVLAYGTFGQIPRAWHERHEHRVAHGPVRERRDESAERRGSSRRRPGLRRSDLDAPRGDRLLSPFLQLVRALRERTLTAQPPPSVDPGDRASRVCPRERDPREVVARVCDRRSCEHHVRTDRGRLELAQRTTVARAALVVVAVESEIARGGHDPDDDVTEQCVRRLTEVLGGRPCTGTGRPGHPGVVIGVEHQHGAGRAIRAEMCDEAAGHLRTGLEIAQVGKVDAGHEADLAARRAQAHGDGTVPRTKAELVR